MSSSEEFLMTQVRSWRRYARLRMELKWNFIFRMVGVWEQSENSRRTVVVLPYPS